MEERYLAIYDYLQEAVNNNEMDEYTANAILEEAYDRYINTYTVEEALDNIENVILEAMSPTLEKLIIQRQDIYNKLDSARSQAERQGLLNELRSVKKKINDYKNYMGGNGAPGGPTSGRGSFIKAKGTTGDNFEDRVHVHKVQSK